MRAPAVAAISIAILASACTSSSPQQLTGAASSARTSSATDARFAHVAPATAVADGGAITGRVGVPCDCRPPLDVYALSVDGRRYYHVETVSDQTRYSLIGLLPGSYFVLLSTRPHPRPTPLAPPNTQLRPRFPAAYTQFTVCGSRFGCNDHSLVAVQVAAGETTSGIDPDDWYGGSSDFPLIPGPIQPLPSPSAPPGVFSSAQSAAAFEAQQYTMGRLVNSREACPANVACVSLSPVEHDGHAAAYFIGTAGSNQEILACGFYAWSDSAGWHTLDSRCNRLFAFPAVGSDGIVLLHMGETGCVNAHVEPGISARVATCIPDLSAVHVDDGPYYVPGSGSINTDYWWHVAGKGWVVHSYLSFSN